MFNTLSDYLFKTRPLSFVVFGGAFLFSIIITLIYGLFGNFIIKKLPLFYRKTARHIKTLCLYYGFISILFYLVRIERIPYLSMRIWLYLWIIGFWAIAILMIAKEFYKIPIRQKKHFDEQKRKRYFIN